MTYIGHIISFAACLSNKMIVNTVISFHYKQIFHSQTQRFARFSLRMDEWFYPTVYIRCIYWSRLGLKLPLVNEGGQRKQHVPLEHFNINFGISYIKRVFALLALIIRKWENLCNGSYQIWKKEMQVCKKTKINQNRLFVTWRQNGQTLWNSRSKGLYLQGNNIRVISDDESVSNSISFLFIPAMIRVLYTQYLWVTYPQLSQLYDIIYRKIFQAIHLCHIQKHAQVSRFRHSRPYCFHVWRQWHYNRIKQNVAYQ